MASELPTRHYMYFFALRERRLRPLSWFRRQKQLILGAPLLLITSAAFGAQYQGKKVDGMGYWCFARSVDTGKYYPARVVFEHNHANVRLETCQQLQLTLDEEIIEDPEEVVASDPRGLWWALSVDGLEQPDASGWWPWPDQGRRCRYGSR